MIAVHRSPLRIMIAVVQALAIRELTTRFAGYRMGWLWTLIEPAAQVVLFSVMFGFHGARAMPGVDYPVFILTGLILYDVVLTCLTQGLGAIEANQGLFVYRQVKPIDVVTTRVAVEFGLHAAAFLLLMAVFAWVGYQVLPADPLRAFAVLAVAIVLGYGLALNGAVIGHLLPEVRKIIPYATRPLFFLSGVFYPWAAIPAQYRDWLSWNPVLHLLEEFRLAWFGQYPTSPSSLTLAAAVAAAFFIVGMLLYQRYRLVLIRV